MVPKFIIIATYITYEFNSESLFGCDVASCSNENLDFCGYLHKFRQMRHFQFSLQASNSFQLLSPLKINSNLIIIH